MPIINGWEVSGKTCTKRSYSKFTEEQLPMTVPKTQTHRKSASWTKLHDFSWKSDFKWLSKLVYKDSDKTLIAQPESNNV